MAQAYDKYLPVVLAALVVLVLGCWNPPALQSESSPGRRSGHANYLWLSLAALLVGVSAVYFAMYK